MSIKNRLTRLEGHAPAMPAPTGNAMLDHLNLSLWRLKRSGKAWVDVLQSMNERRSNHAAH